MSTNVQELQTVEIPFKKLFPWEENVRTTVSTEGIEELSASIRSLGLLQSLVVKKAPRGKFSIVAGKRRFLAISLLVETGAWPSNSSIPCRLILNDRDLTELSLAENVQREAMHPADEVLAFQKLITNGMCVADIAARFGVSETVVNKRLALARVSPALLDKYRAGEMNLELLQAFTLSDDHTVQEQIWDELNRQPWNRLPRTVRSLLSQDAIPAHDKRVTFVGLDKYEASGGMVKRDLFSREDEAGVYVLDPAKLTRLASAKLEEIAESVKAEGWKWVDVQPEADYEFIHKHRRLRAQEATLAPEAQAEWEALSGEHERLQEQLENEGEENEPGAEEPTNTRLNEIEDRLARIEETRTEVYPDEVKAACGVVVTIEHDGSPKLLCGLLRKEDENALRPSVAGDSSPKAAPLKNGDRGASPYAASLIESLTAEKTAAIAAELTQNPHVALAAVVHALVLLQFGLDLHVYRTRSCLQISSTRPNLGDVKNSLAVASLERQQQEWLTQLPTEHTELWRWCLTQRQDTLLRLLAFCAASCVNAIQTKNDGDGRNRLPHADALASALEIDMTRWFTPTAENCFGRISKTLIAEALTEAGKTPDSTKLARKKTELAKLAEFEVAGTGWLPQPVRIASQSLPAAGDRLADGVDTDDTEGGAA